MRIPGGQQVYPDLGGWMIVDALHEPYSQPVSPVIGMDVNIAEPGEGGIIGDNPGEADHPFTVEHGKHDGIFQRFLHHLPRSPLRPVGFIQLFGDEIDIDNAYIVGDEEIILPFYLRRNENRVSGIC
jgi:hypothetical protein